MMFTNIVFFVIQSQCVQTDSDVVVYTLTCVTCDEYNTAVTKDHVVYTCIDYSSKKCKICTIILVYKTFMYFYICTVTDLCTVFSVTDMLYCVFVHSKLLSIHYSSVHFCRWIEKESWILLFDSVYFVIVCFVISTKHNFGFVTHIY